jgi:hypothetical protein
MHNGTMSVHLQYLFQKWLYNKSNQARGLSNPQQKQKQAWHGEEKIMTKNLKKEIINKF